jgi:hypothetical protein
MCTTKFNFQKLYVLPQSIFMCFVWIWEQTAIISLYSINWLVCITYSFAIWLHTDTNQKYLLTPYAINHLKNNMWKCYIPPSPDMLN